MKILLLHLTDIHIDSNNHWVLGKEKLILDVIKDKIYDIDKLYFLITGDICFSGSKNEYKSATKFVNNLKIHANIIKKDCRVSIIMVPGNHDCNFSYSDQIRETVVEKMDYVVIGDKDDSVIESCLKVQNDFWDFYRQFNSLPKSRLLYTLNDTIKSKTIRFTCINSAWMSSKEEKPGSLFFPVKIAERLISENNKADLNISLLHHPVSWFNPNTPENNKYELLEFLNANSQIKILGHEHINKVTKSTDLNTDTEILSFAGKPLDNNNAEFQSLLIDLNTNTLEITSHKWEVNIFKTIYSKKVQINNNKDSSNGRLKPTEEFLTSINSIEIPLQFEHVDNVKLSNLFVYPDLDRFNSDFEIDDDYIDSFELLKDDSLSYSIIEGENQSGKTSLLRMIYREAFKKGLTPIIIDGKDLINLNIEKILQSCFKDQYGSKENYDYYTQLEDYKKIILIDNIQNANLNASNLCKAIAELSKRSKRLIATISSIYGYISSIESELPDYNLLSIKPLGYKKRNDLISKYHNLNESEMTLNDEILLNKVKISFDQVQNILGNKLVPSYPVFILTILQSLSYSKPLNLEQSAFGYCYQSLIHIALSAKAKVENEDIDSYFNILSELAYILFSENKKSLTRDEFRAFYDAYSTKYISPKFESLETNITVSNILICDDNEFVFSYKYIYYFLVARKIGEVIHTSKGKGIIDDLCNNLHSERNANILVFVAHHSKDDYLIESTTFSSMIPFENIEPISLKRSGKYYELIKDIAADVSNEIIDASRKPEEERDLMLSEKDEFENNLNKSRKKTDINQSSQDDDDQIIKDETLPLFQAFKSIEIVGQIIRNRKGSLDKNTLTNMIKELYFTGFRTISYMGEVIGSAQDEFVESLKSRITEDDSRAQITKKINEFFQFISLQTCLGVFTKICMSVGSKDLKKLYDEVSDQIDTPAAKLVTFGIKTYYDRMSIRELQKYAEDFKNNPVALKILKARVRSYIYYNHIDYQSKQKISSALNMKIGKKRK